MQFCRIDCYYLNETLSSFQLNDVPTPIILIAMPGIIVLMAMSCLPTVKSDVLRAITCLMKFFRCAHTLLKEPLTGSHQYQSA